MTMKRLMILVGMTITLFMLSNTQYPVNAMGRFDMFYSSLRPYGEWVNCSYGHVWRPVHVDHGWRPYLYGRWAWTDFGWYWVSEEPFGWATFHYGRWQYDDYYGWIWVPDDVWGPAWVEWRYDDDYIGWAPLSVSAHFNFSFGMTFDAGWIAPIHYWNFIPARHFNSGRVVDYVQPVERTRRFFGNTRGVRDIVPEGSRVVNRGVDVGFVERRTRSRIDRTDVVTRTQGEGERMIRSDGSTRIEVYRPRLDRQGRGEATNTEVNRSDRRRIEVQRDVPTQREVLRDKQQLRENRQTDPQRTYQQRQPERLQRREVQVERRNQTVPRERQMNTQQESRTRESSRSDRQQQSQRERQQTEPRRGRR